jgi:hypothetical protein
MWWGPDLSRQGGLLMVAPDQSVRVAEAMDAALTAERAAEEAVREAQLAGALAIREATELAAQIASRCDERVRRVHDRCAAALAQHVADLVKEDPAERFAVQVHDTQLDELLDRVAAWLTSSK